MVTLKEEDGRITNLQQALPAGLTTITDCKDFNFAITDQDDFTRQADIVLSIGGSGILSLMDALSNTNSGLGNYFRNVYKTAYAKYSQKMNSSYDFVTPRIPPAWALSRTAHLRNENCQLPPYDIVGFAT